MIEYAPILIFVYNRIDHAKSAIEALLQNPEAKESHLYIYSDGPKNAYAVEKVHEVRRYISGIDGFGAVTIIERPENYGIEKSEISAITETFESYDKAIILEDDIIVSKFFLNYMNATLERYKSEKCVFEITGYSYLEKKDTMVDTMFLKIASAWGWATWADRWEKFDPSPTAWLKLNKKEVGIFNYDGAYDWYGMMKNQYADNQKLTWDICWYWTIYSNNGLVLWPSALLCINSGFDGTGVHCPSDEAKIKTLVDDISEIRFPKDIRELRLNRKRVSHAIQKETISMTLQYKFPVFRNHLKIRLLKALHLWED